MTTFSSVKYFFNPFFMKQKMPKVKDTVSLDASLQYICCIKRRKKKMFQELNIQYCSLIRITFTGFCHRFIFEIPD